MKETMDILNKAPKITVIRRKPTPSELAWKTHKTVSVFNYLKTCGK